MKNIIWVSRHTPTARQHNEISQWLGEPWYVKTLNETINTSSDVLKEVDENTVGIMAVLSPDLMCDLVNSTDLPVFRAVMGREVDSQSNASFVHRYFEIIEEMVVKTRKML